MKWKRRCRSIIHHQQTPLLHSLNSAAILFYLLYGDDAAADIAIVGQCRRRLSANRRHSALYLQWVFKQTRHHLPKLFGTIFGWLKDERHPRRLPHDAQVSPVLYVDLSFSQLNRIPTQIKLFDRADFVYLNYNDIKSIQSGLINYVDTTNPLRRLFLNWNQLTTIAPGALKGWFAFSKYVENTQSTRNAIKTNCYN